MPAWNPPRYITASTSVAVTNPVAWPQSVAVSTYASVPLVNTIASVSPDLAFSADYWIGGSYSANLTWNDDYGPGGGGVFTGGGHSTTDWAHAWVFDGSLPGWVQITNFPTTQLAVSTSYANGAEISTTQANMPVDAEVRSPYYLKAQPLHPSWPAPYGYPAATAWEYGEVSTGVPVGFHSWNSLFRIPAGVAGMGAKGGWGCVCHHSMSTQSGQGAPWGHKLDAATGQWTRWPVRIPAFNIGNDMGACMRAASDGNYAYTKWSYPTGPGSKSVRTDLTTGAHTVINHTGQIFSTNNLVIIPGTTVAVWLGPADTTNIYSSSNGKASLWTCLMQEGSAQVLCNMTNNTMPTSTWWDSTTPGTNSAFGQAGLVWVPEVGKLAAFHQANAGSTNGTWPMRLYWITPPANVQTNYASGTWTVSEESLTIPGGDSKANNATNRGPWGYQYMSFAWSSKLRCFLHFPRPGNAMCFFIRSSQVP